jgi:hypothetical protein
MGEGGVFGSPMLLFLPRRKIDYIPRADGYLFSLRGHNTLALGNNKYLFNGVAVELVPYPPTEVYLPYEKFPAQTCAYNRLIGDWASKQWAYRRLFCCLSYLDYLHCYPPLSQVKYP